VAPKYKGKQLLLYKNISLRDKLYFLFSAKVVSLALFFNEYGKYAEFRTMKLRE